MKETKKSSRQIDMLNGPLLGKILLFALPVAASSILQQLFNSADVAVVGRFAGSQAMAAVGCNASVTSLLINLFVGLSVGANVVIANYVGQRSTDKVQDVVHTVMTMAILSGIFLLALGFLVARPILTLMNTPEDVIEQAVLYLRIYFLGMPFFMVYNFGSAVLRSIGDTRRPMYALLFSGIINVCLNLFFVILLKMGVAGVGTATAIANLISAGMVVWFLTKEEGIIHLDLRQLKLKKEHVLRVIRIGAPAGLQGMVFSLSNVCIQSAINGFGSAAVAGSAAAVNFEYFTYFMTSSFAQAATTFTSQNFGAGQYKRCKKIAGVSIAGGLVATICMSLVFVLGRDLFLLFYTTDKSVMAYALVRVTHVEIMAFLPVFYEVGAGALRGIGYSMLPAIITLLGSCAFRFVWVYTVFKQIPTFDMLMNVYPVTWIITATAMMGAYFLIQKKVLKTD
ncbi:MAG: MATE family efflux transporter [Lachnospiraceae bacterium]|nr:MATE family efflux transporter [Lachnospiraceae bacterium]